MNHKYDTNIKFIKRDNISDLINQEKKKVIYFSPILRRSSDLYLIWVGFHRDRDPPGYSIYLKKIKNKYNIVSVKYPDFDPVYIHDYIKELK